MSADDMLDQDHWHAGVDVAHLLVEHGAAAAELRARRLTADQQIRAAALDAAVAHLPLPTWEQNRTDVVLRTAETFARWIAGEPHGCDSPGSAPESPSAGRSTPSRYPRTGETADGNVGGAL